jgi:hypothetical protein
MKFFKLMMLAVIGLVAVYKVDAASSILTEAKAAIQTQAKATTPSQVPSLTQAIDQGQSKSITLDQALNTAEQVGKILQMLSVQFAPMVSSLGKTGVGVNDYFLEPVGNIGGVLADLRMMKGSLDLMQEKLKGMANLATCSNFKPATIERFSLPDEQLSAAEKKAKAICVPLGCSGNKLACIKQALIDFQLVLTTLRTILLDKNGLGFRLFSVAKQGNFFQDLESKYINTPIAQIDNLLSQLIGLMGSVSTDNLNQSANKQTPAQVVVAPQAATQGVK